MMGLQQLQHQDKNLKALPQPLVLSSWLIVTHHALKGRLPAQVECHLSVVEELALPKASPRAVAEVVVVVVDDPEAVQNQVGRTQI